MAPVFEIVNEDGSVRISARPGECIVLGRNPLTRVKDKSVSKQHLQIEFGASLRYRQLGSNPSTINATVLKKDQTLSLPSDTDAMVYLYKNDHCFRVIAAPVPLPASKPAFSSPSTSKTSSKASSKILIQPRHSAGSSAKKRPLSPLRDEDSGSLNDFGPPKKKPAAPFFVNSWLKKDGGDDETAVNADGWTDLPSEKLIIFTPSGVVAGSEILGFDVDSTIIATKSGKTFGVDYDDWKILFPNCIKKIEAEAQNGKKICFFTNQAGIERGKVDKKKFQKKIESILRALRIPIQVFVSCGDGMNRKPLPGMWEALEKRFNESVFVDRSRSLYVGDAAGRPENWKPKRKKDFSSADRLFAINLGVPFQVPEEFFQGISPPPFSLPDFDPRSLRLQKELIASPKTAKLVAGRQEIVVLAGSPAAGKSTFAKNHLIPHSYVHVNRDSLGSWQKCVQLAKDALQSGKSVVVDNTNSDLQTRQRYVSLAKDNNIPVRCFLFQVSTTMARHMNKFRKLAFLDKAHKDVNDIIIYSHHKNFQEPTLSEGFQEIVQINFVPVFDGVEKEKETLFFHFLIEK